LHHSLDYPFQDFNNPIERVLQTERAVQRFHHHALSTIFLGLPGYLNHVVYLLVYSSLLATIFSGNLYFAKC